MRSLGDERAREVVHEYVEAWERGDVEAVVAMLAEDATFSMPPLRTWYGGRDEIAHWSRSESIGVIVCRTLLESCC